jgi:AcrR family transcriptional regulator
MAPTAYHHGDLKNALIKAGVEILAREGLSGLSLRKVARLAGVSHAAPYAHFADKQSLIAAISTEGFKQLYAQIESVRAAQEDNPIGLLTETAWATLQFALIEPDRFKLMFSSALDKEKDYPDFVASSQQNFRQLVEIVERCQNSGILKAGPSYLAAVSVWGVVHGLIMLVLEGQISHLILDQYSLREVLLFALNQITLTELN